MVKKFVSLIIIVCLSLTSVSLLAGCGSSKPTQNDKEKPKVTKNDTSEVTKDDISDEEFTKKEIAAKYKEAALFTLQIFYSGSIDDLKDKIDESDSFDAEDGSKYYRFTYKNINTLAGFKKEMSSYFTDDVCENYIGKDGQFPNKFAEKDGKLYINLTGGIGFRNEFKVYIEKSSEKNAFKLYLISMSYEDNSVPNDVVCFIDNKSNASGQNPKRISNINFKKTKDGWKFDTAIVPPIIGLQDGDVPIFSEKDKKPYIDILKKFHKLAAAKGAGKLDEVLATELYDLDPILITQTDVFGIPGYYIEDINGDGIKELLFGKSFQTADSKDDNNRMIYQIFTLKDGKPVSLCESGAKYRYYLTSDNKLLFYSSGFDYNTTILFEFPKNSDKLVKIWEKENDPTSKDGIEIKSLKFRPLLFDDDLAE